MSAELGIEVSRPRRIDEPFELAPVLVGNQAPVAQHDAYELYARLVSGTTGQNRVELSLVGDKALDEMDAFFEEVAKGTRRIEADLGFGVRLGFNPREKTQEGGKRVTMNIGWPEFLKTDQTREIWGEVIGSLMATFWQQAKLMKRDPPFTPLIRYDERVWQHLEYLMHSLEKKIRREGGALYVSLPDPEQVSRPLYLEKVAPFVRDVKETFDEIRVFFNLLEYADKTSLSPIFKGKVHDFRNRICGMMNCLDNCDRASERGKTVNLFFLLPPHSITSYLNLPGWHMQVREAEITYTVNVSPDIEPGLMLSHDLERILQNMISNSIKYRQPGLPPFTGWLAITVAVEGDTLRITAEDNGRGMEQVEADNQWGWGDWRASEVAKAGIPGEGIGSTVIRRLTEKLGGTLSIASRKWKEGKPGGTRIVLEFEKSRAFEKDSVGSTEEVFNEEWLAESRRQWESDPANPSWSPEKGMERLT
ncbi:MAG: ATP-binding protein, partial [bacterium]|nr:ATP-binding protein [bacterium]